MPLPRIIILSLTLMLASCSSTELTSVWTDETRTRQLDSILVVGISSEDHRRRVFEDAFVEAVQSRGLNAAAGYQVLEGSPPDADQVLNRIIDMDVDAVLVTHAIGVENAEVYHPPRVEAVPYGYYNSFHGYYSHVYNYVQVPGYTTQHLIVRLETNLYDAADRSLLWSAQSQTVDPESLEKLIAELTKEITSGLADAGFM